MTSACGCVRLHDAVGRALALVLSAQSLGCQGNHYCSGFVDVICVSSEGEAEWLNQSAGCGVSYEVCSPQDASFTPPPDAIGSLSGDGAMANPQDARTDAANDAHADVASDAPGD